MTKFSGSKRAAVALGTAGFALFSFAGVVTAQTQAAAPVQPFGNGAIIGISQDGTLPPGAIALNQLPAFQQVQPRAPEPKLAGAAGGVPGGTLIHVAPNGQIPPGAVEVSTLPNGVLPLGAYNKPAVAAAPAQIAPTYQLPQGQVLPKPATYAQTQKPLPSPAIIAEEKQPTGVLLRRPLESYGSTNTVGNTYYAGDVVAPVARPYPNQFGVNQFGGTQYGQYQAAQYQAGAVRAGGYVVPGGGYVERRVINGVQRVRVPVYGQGGYYQGGVVQQPRIYQQPRPIYVNVQQPQPIIKIIAPTQAPAKTAKATSDKPVRIVNNNYNNIRVVSTATSAAAAYPMAAVATAPLNYRNCPSVSCKRLGTVPAGKNITLTGCKSKWCSAVINNRKCWVSRKFVGIRR